VKHSGAVLVKDQTLFVNTDSAALANELALREHEFVEKLNTCLRKPLIKRIRFKQGHVRSRNSMGTTKERVRADLSLKTLQKIDEIVHDVREDELRDKLRKLLIAAARRNKIS
jgi:hypothetical protein